MNMNQSRRFVAVLSAALVSCTPFPDVQRSSRYQPSSGAKQLQASNAAASFKASGSDLNSRDNSSDMVSVTVIFKNSARVRVVPGEAKVTAADPSHANALNGLLQSHAAARVFDAVPPSVDENKLKRFEQVTLNRLGREIAHPRSVQWFQFSPTVDRLQIVNQLKKHPAVINAYITPKGRTFAGVLGGSNIFHISGSPVPTDPVFTTSSGNLGYQRDNWPQFNKHKVIKAWEEYNPSAAFTPKIAVIDDGFYHESPSSPYYDANADEPNYDMAQAAAFYNGWPDTNNGTPQLLVEPPPSLTGEISHGTSAASMIASPKNNGAIACGVVPGATLIPIKVTLDEPSYVAAIYHATLSTDAGVISCSLGFHDDTSGMDWPLTNKDATAGAIALATTYCNKVVVIAAGNTCNNLTTVNCPKFGEILVAANHPNGLETNYTNFGSAVDVVACGENMRMPAFNRQTRVFSSSGWLFTGTSAATPIVAGIAAMARAVNNSLDPEQVRETIVYGSSYGITSTPGLYLGWDLEAMPVLLNPGRVARQREVNAFMAVLLAKKAFSKSWTVRLFNSHDIVTATRNSQWFAPRQFEVPESTDTLFDLSLEGFVTGDNLNFRTTKSSGNYQRASAGQVFYFGKKKYEYINGVARKNMPWGNPWWAAPPYNVPLYPTYGVTTDTSSGSNFDLMAYSIP